MAKKQKQAVESLPNVGMYDTVEWAAWQYIAQAKGSIYEAMNLLTIQGDKHGAGILSAVYLVVGVMERGLRERRCGSKKSSASSVKRKSRGAKGG